MKIVLFLLTTIVVITAGFFLINKEKSTPTTSIPKVSGPTISGNQEDIPAIAEFANNLTVPWAIGFLPDGKMVVTERAGEVNIIENGNLQKIGDINVHSQSESGLHGVAVDPDFSSNNYIYLYYTYRPSGANTLNKVTRFTLKNNSLSDEKVIVDGIPGVPNHDGGRLKFGPDGFLYITTGDAQEPSSAQDKNTLAGKILRVTKDGTGAPGNPFGSRIFSYGHRNPQGIAFDNQGRLWETEHGPSGSPSGLDELNLIEAGKNYGWPDIMGNQTKSGMVTPMLNSGSNDTWAPGGAAIIGDSIFFAGLRGNALYEAKINGENIELIEHLKGELGRIREVVLGPDGMLYITTSNKDGRGNPRENDDKIYRINPGKVSEL